MATDTAAFTTLQVIPVIEGVGRLSTSNSAHSAGWEEGRQAARRRPGRGVEAAAKRVEAATEKVSKANDKAADSAGKLRTAEAQLQTLRDKGVNDAGRLVAAEEKVARPSATTRTRRRMPPRPPRISERAEKDAADAADDTGDKMNKLGVKSVFTAENIVKAGGDDGHGVRRCRKVLYDIGAQFDDVTDTIRIGTGATGTQLDSRSTLSRRLAPKFRVRSPTSGRVSLI